MGSNASVPQTGSVGPANVFTEHIIGLTKF